MRHETFEAERKFEIRENTMDRPPRNVVRSAANLAVLGRYDLVVLVGRHFRQNGMQGSSVEERRDRAVHARPRWLASQSGGGMPPHALRLRAPARVAAQHRDGFMALVACAGLCDLPDAPRVRIADGETAFPASSHASWWRCEPGTTADISAKATGEVLVA